MAGKGTVSLEALRICRNGVRNVLVHLGVIEGEVQRSAPADEKALYEIAGTQSYVMATQAGVFEWDRRHNAPWVSDWFHNWMAWILSNGGLILIWIAGFLTIMTGYDYLMKALPFLRDRKR